MNVIENFKTKKKPTGNIFSQRCDPTLFFNRVIPNSLADLSKPIQIKKNNLKKRRKLNQSHREIDIT